jgi:hypothetical protein
MHVQQGIRCVATTTLVVVAGACSSPTASTSGAQPLGSEPPAPGSAVDAATAPAGVSGVGSATAAAATSTSPPASSAPPPSTGSTAPPPLPRCSKSADCPAGSHCALGEPLEGKCWPDGKPEPRCLAKDTLVATPRGEVRVGDLRVGDPVYTVDAHGRRIAVSLIQTTRLPVRPGHRMTRLELDDGRVLVASEEHPTCALASGASSEGIVARLAVGGEYDGAGVKRSEVEIYREPATFDVLPAGDTGCYWANGVLVGSTLR